MTTLIELIEASRVFALRQAAVAKLRAEFSGVEVKSWPGKLNVQDMVAKTNINPPAVLVAVTMQRPPEDLVSGIYDEPVEFTAYVVAENRSIGTPKKLYAGDEIGLALCGGLVRFLKTDAGRWGTEDVGHPDEVRAQPVLTLGGLEQGTAFFTVTWRQTVYGQGAPRPLAAEGPTAPPPPFVPGLSGPGDDLEVGL